MKSLAITDFGGRSGGFDNTSAFAMALAEIARSGGGRLVVPAGVWRVGAVSLESDMTLELEEGAVLSFIPDPVRYTPVYTRWEGVECYAMHPLIYANGRRNVVVTGRGVLDGNGGAWWEMKRRKKAAGQSRPEEPFERLLAALNPGYEGQPGGGGGREIQFLRPCLVEFANCANVRIEGVALRNSPFWTVHPLYSTGVEINGITVENPADAPNTDGIDVDSCSDVRIVGCSVSVGDDGICLKSGSGADGLRVNRATDGVVIRGCTVRDAHGGIVIGSETAAGIRNVLAEDCDLLGTDRGIRIKSRRGRGGEISGIELRNLRMEGNLCPIALNMFYKCGVQDRNSPLFSLEGQPVTPETPCIRDVRISGVRASGCRASAGFVAGLPEMPVENLEISSCRFSTDEDSPASPMESDMFYGLPEVSGKGFRVLNAPGAVFRDVVIEGPAEPFVYG